MSDQSRKHPKRSKRHRRRDGDAAHPSDATANQGGSRRGGSGRGGSGARRVDSNAPRGGRTWLVGIVGLAIVGLIGVFLWQTLAPRDAGAPGDGKAAVAENGEQEAAAGGAKEAAKLPDGFALVGGVPRPESDVRKDERDASTYQPPKKRQGFAPALDPDTNPQVKLVSEALKTRDKPERFSSFVTPHNFDAEKFKANPSEYAAEYAGIVEPGRVFAPAQPGPGVTAIRSESKRFHRVKQGEAVRLSVEAVPNAPVTFSSFKLGQFENQLTSITAVAGADGIATAEYTAAGGTIDEVHILAASPVTSGQVAFLVSVQVPPRK